MPYASEYIAVIQAGGMGTRLYPLTHDEIPKPMLRLDGKPMIEWQIDCLKRYGVKEYIIVVGHLGDKIKEYFGDGTCLGISVSYLEENEPLGSAGALFYLKDTLREKKFFLIYSDVMFDIDIDRMIAFHEKKQALATILVHPNAHPSDSDLVVMGDDGRIIAFDDRDNIRTYWYDNIVNAGIHILDGEMLKELDYPRKIALEKELLAHFIPLGRVYGYRTTEYVKDVGTVDRFKNAENDKKKKIWTARNLSQMQKCIFLDRDGTINKYKGLIAHEDEFELEENAAEAIRKINESGYLAIVVTNQPVVARGMCDIDDVKTIHKKMTVLLGEQGAYLDDIIFCPHHPDKGYPEENRKYKIDCSCRKPKTGMIEKMKERYNIDLSMSYMIGDSTVDVQTGVNSGMSTVLLRCGQGGKDRKYDVKPDMWADDILDAVTKIIGGEKSG